MRKKMSMKWFLMIFCCTCRQVPNIIPIREVLFSNWWKQNQAPTAKHYESLENPAQEGKERLQEPEGSRIPQENPQNQPIWTQKGSLRLNWQSGSLHGPSVCVTVVYFGAFVELLAGEVGAVSDTFDCFWYPFPPIGLPCPALIGEEMPGLIATWCTVFDWYP